MWAFVCKSSCQVCMYKLLTEPLHSRYMCVCTHCGHFTLFFQQPASLLTSYIPSLLLLLLTSFSISPPAVGLTSERAQCADWTEGVLSQFAIRRKHTNISTNMTTSHWAAAVCLAYIGDLTARYWCEKCVCAVCVCRRISVAGKVTACSSFLFCLWSFF